MARRRPAEPRAPGGQPKWAWATCRKYVHSREAKPNSLLLFTRTLKNRRKNALIVSITVNKIFD
jgi:hypothetical protein